MIAIEAIVLIIMIKVVIVATMAIRLIPIPKDYRISCPSYMDWDGQLPLVEQHSNPNSSACSAIRHPLSHLSATIALIPITMLSTTS